MLEEPIDFLTGIIEHPGSALADIVSVSTAPRSDEGPWDPGIEDRWMSFLERR